MGAVKQEALLTPWTGGQFPRGALFSEQLLKAVRYACKELPVLGSAPNHIC